MTDKEKLIEMFNNCKSTDIACEYDNSLTLCSIHSFGGINFEFDENNNLEKVYIFE